MKEKKKTIILVEHKIDLIAEYTDEVIAMKNGEVIAGGSKKQILSDLSLLEAGIALPQVAILGRKLVEKGLELPEIPVTEKEAVEMIGSALKARKK